MFILSLNWLTGSNNLCFYFVSNQAMTKLHFLRSPLLNVVYISNEYVTCCVLVLILIVQVFPFLAVPRSLQSSNDAWHGRW